MPVGHLPLGHPATRPPLLVPDDPLKEVPWIEKLRLMKIKKNQEFFDRLGLDEARRALQRPKRPRQKKAPAAIVPRQMPARGKQLHPLDEYAVGFDFGTPALDPPALHFSSRRAFLPLSPQATPPR